MDVSWFQEMELHMEPEVEVEVTCQFPSPSIQHLPWPRYVHVLEDDNPAADRSERGMRGPLDPVHVPDGGSCA